MARPSVAQSKVLKHRRLRCDAAIVRDVNKDSSLKAKDRTKY